jgi:hypothetical protein
MTTFMQPTGLSTRATRSSGGSEMMRNRKNMGRKALSTIGIAVALLTACDFETTNPTAVTEEDLNTDAAMTALLVGAARSFDDAFNRSVMFTGVVSDELIASGSWIAWHLADKEGFIDPNAYEGDHANIPWRMWRELHRTRRDADEAAERMREVVSSPESDLRLAQVQLYSGMAHLMLGESFCELTFDGSAAVPRTEAFTRAEERLNDALSIAMAATNGDNVAGMARLSLARLALEQGDLAGAAAFAQQVPDGFRFIANYRQNQAPYAWNNMMVRGESTVGPEFRETGDPRVPVAPPADDSDVGADGNTPLWRQQKYADEFVNWTVGKWQEARLIQAEHLLDTDDVPGAINLMNDVRQASGLTPLSAGLTKEQAMEALRLETMYELFLENRRMLYMRRWNEFPAGWDTCMPIPAEERRQNPNL